MRILLIAALLAAGPAVAEDRIARNGADSIRLTDAPCGESVRALLPPAVHDKLRAAQAEIGGQKYEACWVRYQGAVYLFYADGDQGEVPEQAFKPVTEI